MADNSLQGGSDTIRDIDKSGVKTQVFAIDTGGSGAESLVTTLNPLSVSVNAANFTVSSNNSSTAQLAAGQSFTGVLETALNQPSISLLMTSDQPMVVTVKQYIDASGLYPVTPIVISVVAGQTIDQSFPLNGNYVNITAKNAGYVTTTTFNLNTAYGTLGAATALANVPVAINEIGGTAISGSVPVSLVLPLNGLKTSDESLKNAQSSDAPLATFITGDPSGDFAGINLLEAAFSGDLRMPVTTDIAKDANGAMRIADGAVFTGSSANVNIPLVPAFDTTGYNSVNVYCGGGSASVVIQFSEDGVFWNNGFTSANASLFSAGAQAVSAGSPINLVAPIAGRYCKVALTSYSSGTVFGVARLRSALVQPLNASNILSTQITNSTGSSYPAEDSAIGSMPTLVVGGKVRTAIAPNTLVAGDAAMITFNDSAALIVENHAVRQLTWAYAAATLGITNTSTAVTIKAAVASQRGNITSIQLYSEALATATEFAIRDGAAGAVMWRIKIPTTGMPPTNFTFDPPLPQAAVNTLMEVVTLTLSATGAVYFNAQGFMSN